MPDKRNHIIQLDALRCIAVLFVAFGHLLQWKIPNEIVKSVPSGHGVILFYVLSGFLITDILLSQKNHIADNKTTLWAALKKFYIRRTLRIFPLYYLTLLVCFCLSFEDINAMIGWLLTYTSNIYQAVYNNNAGSYNHFWSLAVEEQFYLVWPLIVLLIPQKYLLRTIIVTIALSLVAKFLFFLFATSWMAAAYLMPCCMNTLCIGSALAYLKHNQTHKYEKIVSIKNVIPFLLLGYWIFFAIIHTLNFEFTIAVLDEFIFAIVCFFIVAKASVNGFRNVFSKFFLQNKLVLFIGTISYGIYVFHLFSDDIFFWVVPKLKLGGALKYEQFAYMMLITFILSVLSWFLIERPILKLKNKLT